MKMLLYMYEYYIPLAFELECSHAWLDKAHTALRKNDVVFVVCPTIEETISNRQSYG